MAKKGLVWFRRDLRIHDHHALSEALQDCDEVYLCFVYDTTILEKLPRKDDHRLNFIQQSLVEMEKELQSKGGSILLRYGNPTKEIPALIREEEIDALYFNRDYEPSAKERDSKVTSACQEMGVEVHHYKDLVIFEKHEVLTQSGNVFKVFTPYSKKWLELFEENGREVPQYRMNWSSLKSIQNSENALKKYWPAELGFTECPPNRTGGANNGQKRLREFIDKKIDHYKMARDYPAQEGTSQLSVYLRHGNISIREAVRAIENNTEQGPKTWLNELMWRDFYQAILDEYPKVVSHPFRPEYEKIQWRGGKKEFQAWCDGQTGFPLIDAAMRGLKKTGEIHNRNRMIVASFLCKTLLVDWRKGEQHFADFLLDFDLAANNGGWQWAASTGTDAQPYFRIFNPMTQSEKFDSEGEFIRVWVPELKNYSNKKIHAPWTAKEDQQKEWGAVIGKDYPCPIVDYKENREAALEMYSVVKKK